MGIWRRLRAWPGRGVTIHNHYHIEARDLGDFEDAVIAAIETARRRGRDV